MTAAPRRAAARATAAAPAKAAAPPKAAAPAKAAAPPKAAAPAKIAAPRKTAAPRPVETPASAAASGPELVIGADGLARCRWGASTPDYLGYHDTEWGRPIRDDDGLYERLTLEGFQSGLSWLTILRKRPAFRAAFADFQLAAVAAFTEADVDRLLNDAGIVRNRSKIEAAIGNARAALDLPTGLADLIWEYAPAPRPRPDTFGQVPASTPESVALAKRLRKDGLRFIGPTTAYALMQAAGLVDDHLAGCHVPPYPR